jgi:hypothetical protein
MAMLVNHTRRGFSRVIGRLSPVRDIVSRVRLAVGRGLLTLGCAACGRGFFNPLPADASGSATGSDGATIHPAIAFVQSQSGAAGGDFLQLSLPTPQHAGDTNVVTVSYAGADLSLVSDSNHNVYATALGPLAGSSGVTEVVLYAPNIAAGVDAVMVNFSSMPTFLQGGVYEYENIAPQNSVDNATGLFGAGGVQAASGLLDLASDGDLLFASVCNNDTSSTNIASFTLRTITPTMLVEDAQAPTSGQYNAATSDTISSSWIDILVGFRRN